jgi:ATP-dependent RNA helicase DeaD
VVHKPLPPRPAEAPKPRKAVAENQTRLFLSTGEQNGMGRDAILQLVSSVTKLPPAVLGDMDVRERHTFLDVPSEHAPAIIEKLNRHRLQNRRLKVKVA